MSASAAAAEAGTTTRRLPPVAEILVGSMMLVIASGIYLASRLPRVPALAPAAVLLALSGGLLLVAVALVARLRTFAWPVFFRVTGWVSLAYVVIAGMLEYIFVLDHTRGGMLVVITVGLVIFALDIPILMGFSVARYQESV